MLSMFIVCSATAQEILPRGSDFPVRYIYKGKPGKLDLSNPQARKYRTILRSALEQSPNFAGEYIIVMWGCGTDCRVYSFINK